jgi:peptidoglycan/LPS O-acetylase OafA/YrhL
LKPKIASSLPDKGGTRYTKNAQIQGIRAIAVLLVVAFHAGLPVKAGFYGVDVFFVISGFVITQSLSRLLDSDFPRPLRKFYLNRFWRIAPALAAMVTAVTLVSGFLSSPLGARQIADITGISALLGAANLTVARTTGGYFDPPAATNPLLHTWSLGVEEQFYFLLPVFLYFLLVIGKRYGVSKNLQVSGVFILGLGSLLLALATAGLPVPAAMSMFLGFYSPFERAWELLTGVFIALVLGNKMINRTYANPMIWTGAVVLSIGLATGSASIPTPGPNTLFPVFGTSLMILGSINANNLLSRTLGSRILTFVGDRSYSIYLWHWPFIVFTTLIWPNTPIMTAISVALSFAIALVSYRYWEQPLQRQHHEGKASHKKAIAIALLPIVLAGVFGVYAQFVIRPKILAGNSQIYFTGDLGQDVYHAYVAKTYFPCEPKAIRDHAPIYNQYLRCQQSKANVKIDVALIGDSHAEHLFPGLATAYPRKNIVFYIPSMVPIFTGADMHRIIRNVVSNKTIQTVILNAHWIERGMPLTDLEKIIGALLEAGKSVWLANDSPSFPSDPFECKYGLGGGIGPSINCSQPLAGVLPQVKKFDTVRHALKSKFKELHLLETFKYFCGNNSCSMTDGGDLLYRDSHHLNLLGSEFLGREIKRDNPSLLSNDR